MDQLRHALERAGSGQGQLVAVVGDPGVGKSRLFWEFTHSHRTQGWLIVESSSVSYGKATAFLPLIQVLRTYFQIEARDDARKIREKVTGKLFSLDRALEPSLPTLLWLLDVSVDDPQWQRLDPPQRRQQTLDGIKRLLLRESQIQPLLLLFEDLHWIDAETQAFLDSMVESVPTARLLLLVNYRPEYQHGWGGKTYYRQLRIDPLPPESAEELLEVLLGNDAGLEPLKRLLIERTEGNPFFLEESVRTLVETKVLAGERGAYHLARAFLTLQVPATAQAILAARIDRLAPEDKRLLQAASVIGKDVPFTLLQAIADMPEDSLRRGLTHLQAAEFLYETNLFPDLEYTFKHALTQEVSYGSLLHDRRRALHARVLAAMEDAGYGRLSLNTERLAHHALKGEEWGRAAQYLHLAGRRAIAEARYPSGVGFYEAAIHALDQQGDDADQTLKLDAYLELGTARTESSQLEGYRELMDRAEVLARALNDRARLAQVRVRQAQGLWNLWSGPSNLEAAIEGAREAFALAAPDDLRTRSYAQFLVGAASLARGCFRDAVREFNAGVTLFTTVPVDAEAAGLVVPIRANLRAWEAEAHAALGEFGPALAAADEAQQIASGLRHPSSQGLTAGFRGYVLLMQGQLEAARRTFERGLAGSPFFSTTSSIGLALCKLLLGQRDDGLRALSRGLEISGDPLAPQRKIMTRYGILPAGAYLAAGLPEEAESMASRGLALATVDNARAYQVPLGRIRAEALALLGKEPCDDEALSNWGRLIDLATELSMRPEMAHCHLGLGKLYRRTGDHAKAAEHLMTASAMYREMDMGFWLEKAESACAGGRFMTRVWMVAFLALALLATPLAADAQPAGKIPASASFVLARRPIPSSKRSAKAFASSATTRGETSASSTDGRREDRTAPGLAADLVRLKMDVIVAGVGAVEAAKRVTTTIPIVMPVSTDPVRAGLVTSLARPGGNITGVTTLSGELPGKWLELLRETVPRISRVAVLWDSAGDPSQVQTSEAAARSLGVRLHVLKVGRADGFESAFAEARKREAGALIVVGSSLFYVHRARLVELAAKHRIPTIYAQREFVGAPAA